MPDSIRAGATEMDLSVREYTGNPRDAAGYVPEKNAGNRLPAEVPRNEGAV